MYLASKRGILKDLWSLPTILNSFVAVDTSVSQRPNSTLHHIYTPVTNFRMDSRLKGRVAAITGGSSGLGRATAIRFADAGARVVVADLKSSGVETEITKKHGDGSAIFVKCDVTKEDDIKNLVEEAVKFGGSLDISCHYAGISIETESGLSQRCHEMPSTSYDRLYAVNERGVWLCCKYALKQMVTLPFSPVRYIY